MRQSIHDSTSTRTEILSDRFGILNDEYTATRLFILLEHKAVLTHHLTLITTSSTREYIVSVIVM